MSKLLLCGGLPWKSTPLPVSLEPYVYLAFHFHKTSSRLSLIHWLEFGFIWPDNIIITLKFPILVPYSFDWVPWHYISFTWAYAISPEKAHLSFLELVPQTKSVCYSPSLFCTIDSCL